MTEVAHNIFDTAPPMMLQVPFSTKLHPHEEKNSRNESSPLSTPRSTTLPSANESSVCNDESPKSPKSPTMPGPAVNQDVNPDLMGAEIFVTQTMENEETERLFNRLFGDSDSHGQTTPVAQAFIQHQVPLVTDLMQQQVHMGSTESDSAGYPLWDFAPQEASQSGVFGWAYTSPKMEEMHFRGECKPCAYFFKNDSCRWGPQCEFCHLCPKGELKARKKEKVRMLRAQQRGVGGAASTDEGRWRGWEQGPRARGYSRWA